MKDCGAMGVKKIFAIASISACLLANQSEAQNLGGSNLVISKILLEFDTILIQAEGIQNPDHCQIANVAILPNDPETSDRFLSVATTAFATGAKVEIWVLGCKNTPWGTAPYVYHMSISK